MAINWGPVNGEETAEDRYFRDVASQGDDNTIYSYEADAFAPETQGRKKRGVDRRGGDVYFTYDVNDDPVRNVEVDGRNNRTYVGPDGETAWVAFVEGGPRF